MTKAIRKAIVTDIEFKVAMYNVFVQKLRDADDAKTQTRMLARVKKELHGVRAAIDIANIADEDFVYTLEYDDYGVYQPAKLVVSEHDVE